jgi:hypothetical protein
MPIRSASASIRDIEFARSSGRSPAPRRNSSAYPRIDVSGVRSSCDASATKRRSRASDARRSSNAASIWASIAFNDVPSFPISVRSSAGSTRRERSPAAIAPAVSPMSSSGRRPSRTSQSASSPARSATPTVTSASIPSSRVSVARISASGTATTSVPPLGCGPNASTRNPGPPPSAGASNRDTPVPPLVEPGRSDGSVGVGRSAVWASGKPSLFSTRPDASKIAA